MIQKKPSIAPLYGAAFGFNTDRRVKPVHFATGFFVSLFGSQFRTELLNNLVAFADGKELSGNYRLDELHEALRTSGKIGAAVTKPELHTIRKHLRCLANNDEAVFPVYGEKEFGCDYTTASNSVLTRTRDNDGFVGYFVHAILEVSSEGKKVLDFARSWMSQHQAPLRQIYSPLLVSEPDDDDIAARYSDKLGELDVKRRKRIAKAMSDQTKALNTLCANAEVLVASETKLRFLIIGLCLWLFRYLPSEGFPDLQQNFVLLADATGESRARMREQSRWSYSRLREALVGSFSNFSKMGRFEECEDAWEYVVNELQGRPKFEEFYGTIALRCGLAQPRASRIPAKHFEPQPDTLRVLVLSVLPVEEGLIPITELLERLFNVWSIVYGGRPTDAELLGKLGYSGLDQDRDLTPNTEALINFLNDLGLATRFSDGLVMCHSSPQFTR
ncbi:hypothetical protein [Prosthecobacter vanneervenii]|uniref:Uncharacterized protein n=1 Tax=Prosthecobacter vanneervenii TaxID=48466 RepID=A0A7W7Y6M1_9BACT|nr:hypothetical protein [Prosthecobacter vanneervenii]MBB5030536.1 hypothetical protein [Prosthecobacter vanneervenii]